MSVFIPGMEMPKGCNECKLCQITDPWEGWYYCELDVWDNEYDQPKTRPEGCPLVEIKTPHGRLIDAGVFRDQLLELARAGKGAAEIWVILFIEEMLNNAPTIIEAEGGN